LAIAGLISRENRNITDVNSRRAPAMAGSSHCCYANNSTTTAERQHQWGCKKLISAIAGKPALVLELIKQLRKPATASNPTTRGMPVIAGTPSAAGMPKN
jgi:hypothetical protein